MIPTPDEFEAWRENAVTRFVLDGVAKFAALQRADWSERSWNAADGEGADQVTLDRLRTRADAYAGLAQITFEQAVGMNEE